MQMILQMGKSEVFKELLSKMKATNCGPFELKMDMDHDALEAFIHFFYSGSVRDEMMEFVADKLLRAADKYKIPLLHQRCQEKLVNSIHPEKIFQLYLLGIKCDAQELVQAVISYSATAFADVSEIHGYEEFLKDDPALVARLCNGVVKRLKKLKDAHIN